jgi:hypothetical protein
LVVGALCPVPVTGPCGTVSGGGKTIGGASATGGAADGSGGGAGLAEAGAGAGNADPVSIILGGDGALGGRGTSDAALAAPGRVPTGADGVTAGEAGTAAAADGGTADADGGVSRGGALRDGARVTRPGPVPDCPVRAPGVEASAPSGRSPVATTGSTRST